jgi:heat shock protein HslJ
MRTLLALLILSYVTSLGACRATGEPAETPTGTWTLVELDGAAPAGGERAPELVIAPDGALSGFAGVNRFSGRLEPEALAGGHIVTGPLAATRMAGPEPAMLLEARILALLGEPLEWRRSEDELTLLLRGATVARLRRVPA